MQIKVRYLNGELSASILDEGIEVSCYINEVNNISDSHKELLLEVEADLSSHALMDTMEEYE